MSQDGKITGITFSKNDKISSHNAPLLIPSTYGIKILITEQKLTVPWDPGKLLQTLEHRTFPSLSLQI